MDGLGRDGFSARVLDSADIIEVAGELIGSPTTSRSDTSLDPLQRIANVRWLETPHYIEAESSEGTTYSTSLIAHSLPTRTDMGIVADTVLRLRGVSLSLAVHATPLDSARSLSSLRNWAEILIAKEGMSGRAVADSKTARRISQIKGILNRLTAGEKSYKTGIRISVRAGSKEGLQLAAQTVKAALEERGFGVAYAAYNQYRALMSAGIFGRDYIGGDKAIANNSQHPNLFGRNLACLFPAYIVDASSDGGVPYGVSQSDDGLFLFDPWSRNIVSPMGWIIAPPGAGKTNALATECQRLLFGRKEMKCWFLDPQGAMIPLARSMGAEVVDVGPEGDVCFNILDLYSIGGRRERLARKLKFLYPIFGMMLHDDLTQSVKAALAAATTDMYDHFENGVSMIDALYQHFYQHKRYGAIAAKLNDSQSADGTITSGVISRLINEVYRPLGQKYAIPRGGLVRGSGAGADYRRPICYFTEGKWWYKGDGETAEPFEPIEARQFLDRALNRHRHCLDRRGGWADRGGTQRRPRRVQERRDSRATRPVWRG